eukprot:TRINITY_DN10165_c0_g1_i1.p1 TRINITY_DN10165_c0_g1~~TRINITY_DN10165_c0_g1_i1.p1  ORF type:complete len:459 (+),score=122.22 TRINITY_DN10165_c0_g1_i1:61-1437(+)
MSFTSPKYEDIDEELFVDRDAADRSQVMSARTQWSSFESYLSTQQEVQILKKIGEIGVIQKNGAIVARILLVLLAKVQDGDHLRYLLTILHDLLVDQPDSIRYFAELQDMKAEQGLPELPFGPLLALLERKSDDAYILSKASSILTIFLSKFSTTKSDKVERTLAWFTKKLNERNSDPTVHHRVQSKVLENLKEILKNESYRLAFTKEGGLEPLFKISTYDSQRPMTGKCIEVLYNALYCIWLLSFNNAVKKFLTRPELVSNLCRLLSVCQEKDKIVRMSLSILKNLLHIQKNNQLMISFDLDRLLRQIKTKPASMADKDVVEDVEILQEALDKVKDELSSFDVYQSEVLGRNLGWSSPTHKSEKFWIENSLKIEDSEVLPTLKEILEKEQRSEVLCVACWDIGEFVRFHPHGKSIVQKLDIKAPIIKLLTSADTNVRSQALLTLQKVMITNWEYLQG